MPQPRNLGVALGASRTGQAVGYRLLNMNGTTQAAFTTANVVEATTPGTYVVTVPVQVADAGARIVWGIAGSDYWMDVIDPVPAVELADNAVTAAALAADAVAEIQGGLATSSALATLTAYVDTEIAAILTNTNRIPADPADASDVAAAISAAQAAIIADTGATETALLSAIGGLPSAAGIVAALMSYSAETGHTVETILRALYAVTRGRFVADSATDPSTVAYYAPDGTTIRVTHTIAGATRSVS